MNKEYITKTFAEAVGRAGKTKVAQKTVANWRTTNHGKPPRLLPARYEGRTPIYTEEQIPLALALLRKKDSDDSGNLFADDKATDVPVVEETANETDGSEEDDDTVADVPVVVPADDSDDDDELIDPPAAPIVDNLLVADDVSAADTSTAVYDAPAAAAQIDAPAADAPVVDKQARIDAAKKFFDLLFRKLTAPHFSYLIKFSGGMNTFDFAVADETQRAEMARKAVELSDMGVDIWHAVNPVSVKPHYEFDEKKGKDVLKRGDEDVVSFQTAVIVDIDIRSKAHKGDPEKLAADFNEAKSFLPFTPSIIVDSGYGLHAYYVFDMPLAITDDNREEIKRRNKRLIDVIRAKAAGKLIDGVDDLPRIFRTPGTKNYKCGKVNAPLCHVVEVNDVRFTPADLDARLDALTPTIPLPTPPEPARAADSKIVDADRSQVNVPFVADDPDLKAFRIRHMLPCINVVKGEYNKWAHVGMGLYNEGLTCADWEQWSRTQPEFKEGECSDKWATFDVRNDGIKIGTLYQWAVEGGYDEKAVQREYYQLHPDKSKKHDTAAQIEKLKADLRDVSKKLKEFDDQRDAALKRLKDVEKFDSDTVFADDVVEAAGFAKLYDKQSFSDLRRAVKIYGDKNKDAKVSVNDWLADVRDKVVELETRRKNLTARATALKAEIKSAEFVAADDELRGVIKPDGYEISDNGIWLVDGERLIQVARLPVLIKEKAFDVDDENYKLILSYKNEEGEWRQLPAQEVATVSDKNKIVALSNKGLPVTSTTAKLLVDYLDAFRKENERNFPLSYTVGRGGWYEFGGQPIFVDPRRSNVVTHDGKKISVVVDDSTFAKALRCKGSLEEWKRAYDLAKSSPVARLMVAASVAAPLLKVLGERIFLLYVFCPTRSGKTTALLLGATAVGSEEIIRSFDGTENGLIGAAAEVNDYVFAIDEKESANPRLKEQMIKFVYSVGNGVGKTRLNKNADLRDLKRWRLVAIMTGETQMLDDVATGGAKTRLLSIAAPKDFLPADTCKSIRDIVADNYGHAFSLVVDKIIAAGKQKLRATYQKTVEVFQQKFPDVLPEYNRYLAVLTLADALLNAALGIDDANEAYDDAIINAAKIFPLIPTTEEISDVAAEKDFVIGFITQNQSRFFSKENQFPPTPAYGKLKSENNYTYITSTALRNACSDGGFNYRKLVVDLITVGFFVPADNIEKGRRTPRPYVKQRIGMIDDWCYRIKNDAL